jgi:hypothetical protein
MKYFCLFLMVLWFVTAMVDLVTFWGGKDPVYLAMAMAGMALSHINLIELRRLK